MPVLMITPDMRAETLLGATGCAAGSQMCNGIMPVFTPKPNRKKQKHQVPLAGRHLVPERVKALEAITAGHLEQEQKSQDEAAGADVGHDEEQDAGVAGFLVFMLEADQAIGGERHDFPGDQEEERVVSQEDQRGGQQQ